MQTLTVVMAVGERTVATALTLAALAGLAVLTVHVVFTIRLGPIPGLVRWTRPMESPGHWPRPVWAMAGPLAAVPHGRLVRFHVAQRQVQVTLVRVAEVGFRAYLNGPGVPHRLPTSQLNLSQDALGRWHLDESLHGLPGLLADLRALDRRAR